FWESNFSRALEWAKEQKSRLNIKTPYAVGAVLDLKYCLDLLQSEYLQIVKAGYDILCESLQKTGDELPKNEAIGNTQELLIRKLDCAVIEMVHQLNEGSSQPAF